MSTATAKNIPQEKLDKILTISDEMRALEGFNPEEFVQRLVKLAADVESKAPGVATYLQEINKNLNQYPELTHILDDDKLAVLTSGMFFVTGVEMAMVTVKARGPKGKMTIEEGMKLF
jgi:hypothetical protein